MTKNILYALISSILLWLAWPPTPYTSPILLFGFLPLLIAIENIFQSNWKNKGRKVFGVAGLCFLTWNTACIYWIWNASPEGSIVAYILGALLMTLSFYLYYKAKTITKPYIADILLVGFWCSYEYLHQTWDLNFPWMTLGNGFATMPQLIQWYEYTGIYGGTLWILMSNILLFNIWKSIRYKNPDKLKLIPALAIWIILPISYSVYTYSNYAEQENPSHIVVVQPNVDPYQKYSGSALQQLDNLIQLSKDSSKFNTEFIIWPETAIPEYLNEKEIRDTRIFHTIQRFLSNYPNATLITGAETFQTYQDEATPSARFDRNSNTYWDSFNTALAIENSGKIQFHHKSKLVPGVEKLPFASALAFMKPIFAKFGGTTGGYGYQDHPTVLYAKSGIGVAAAICYESIWGNWIAEYIKNEAQFIAVVTNDGWWGNTTGKDQHLHYARLRAIENRRWVARSANTGISAFINQRGDIVKKTEWWKPAVISQEINLNSELTFYTKHADIVVYPFLLLGVLGFVYVIFKSRKRRKATE
ncbi:apolipoprotein N-acyltransferase [Pseudopedobacter sp.]|uniref:apolipoprotein N-acyltransferase n=1 Tax=Pseudopedobacter sp. TaxID=1936787 RepID=UPI00333E6521